MVVERIKEYIDYKAVSVSQFERKAGLSNGILGKAIKSNGAIGSDKLEDILRTYSDLNPNWLMTGRESMLTDENLLAKTPASVPTDVHADTSVKETHKAVKAPKMGNYASDRLIEEKQRMYEAQITELKAELMNAHMKIGYLTAEKEELQAKLDTSASRADSATDAPVRKEKAS